MAECNPEVGGRVDRMCQPCLKKDTKRTADSFYPTCREFQCNDCTNGHNIYTFMENHNLLSVSEGVSQLAANDTEVIDMDGLDMCVKHKKPFEFYCEDDKSLTCSSCAILDHRKCDKVVDIAAISKKEKCNELREKLQTAILTTNQAVENITEAESYVNSDLQHIQEQLITLKQTMNEIVDDFAEKVTKDAESYRDATTEDWRQKKIECENKIKTMKNPLKTIENIARRGTTLQQFITAHSMTEALTNEMKNATSLCADLMTLNVSCNFAERFDTLISSLLLAMKPGEFEMKYRVPKETKLAPIASIDLKQTGDDVKQPLYTGLDFLPDGRLVVVDNRNSKCLVYDDNLKSAYKFPYTNPYSVGVVSDKEVAITSGGTYRLDIIHISKSNEVTLNRTCKVNARYDSISMKNEDNFVVSTIDHNPPVRIVTMAGVENDFDIKFPSKKYPINTSFSTYIRGQNKVVLTDSDADTIYIYDVETVEKVVIKDELIKAPFGVAVGPYDHVFVSSQDTNSVVEMTPGGRVLSSHQVDMDYPRYLAVSKDRRRIAIANCAAGSKKLKLYQIKSE